MVAHPVAAQVRRHRPEAGRPRGRVGRAVAGLSAGAAVDAGSARGPLPGGDRHGSLAGVAPHRHPVQAGRDFRDGLRPARGARTRALLLGGHPARRPGPSRRALGGRVVQVDVELCDDRAAARSPGRCACLRAAVLVGPRARRGRATRSRSTVRGLGAGLEGLLHGPDDRHVAVAPASPGRTTATTGAYERSTPDGNAGRWNAGVPFDKDFDHRRQPTIRTCSCATTTPTGRRSAAGIAPTSRRSSLGPGAGRVELRGPGSAATREPLRFDGAATGPRQRLAKGVDRRHSWTALCHDSPSGISYPPALRRIVVTTPTPLVVGRRTAFACRRATVKPDVVSDWTQLRGNGARIHLASCAAASGAEVAMPADRLRLPRPASATRGCRCSRGSPSRARTATTSWSPRTPCSPRSSTSRSHDLPAYAPRDRASPETYPDETTTYYWAVYPAQFARTASASRQPSRNQSAAVPEALGPARAAEPGPRQRRPGQPTFRWTLAEGAGGVTGCRSLRIRPSAIRSTR